MTTQQAYINGFVKRAAAYGYSKAEAISLLKIAMPNANENAPSPVASKPASSPGMMSRAKNWIKSKLPGYPTTVGNTAGAVEDLSKKLYEQAGG